MAENARQFERIYLTDADYYEEGDGPVLWCYECIGGDDVEYVNVAAFDAQAAHIAELEAMLTKLEWSGHAWECCPVCCATEGTYHDDNCALDAVLHKEATDETES